jgi:2-polyprenyl-6-methoxyphenol hydroxylase-like FAD-dependent oxidoreductase
MTAPIERIVVVGGGTAGWLSACTLAARLPHLGVTLVESPDIPTIGVGEGTWPTMRETLATIGIPEPEFLECCDAAFKQGSRFDGWVTGEAGDSYLHPFTLPPAADPRDLLAAWQADSRHASFAAAMTAQSAACAAGLAPRLRAMPEYAGALNYGYHLDAGRFAALLARHATTRMGVTHVSATVAGVDQSPDGDIAAIRLADGRRIEGDLFLDCSGHRALLIEGALGVPWIDRSDVSFNDRALAVQVPVAPDSPIAAQTIGTAHRAGWLWDIGLPTRRGIGCVYASAYLSDDEALAILKSHVAAHCPGADAQRLEPRALRFRTGHRARFWQGNCLAIGQSAGFIEPLEASAIVMIELSLRALCDSFPTDRALLPLVAGRFDALFDYRWGRIVEFLKLHYVLSRRDEPYWRAHRDPASIPARLADSLALWRHHPPSARDFPMFDEVFPAASQQYVLYGMGFPGPATLQTPTPAAMHRLAEVRERARVLTATLPAARTYLTPAAPVPAPARRTA